MTLPSSPLRQPSLSGRPRKLHSFEAVASAPQAGLSCASPELLTSKDSLSPSLPLPFLLSQFILEHAVLFLLFKQQRKAAWFCPKLFQWEK